MRHRNETTQCIRRWFVYSGIVVVLSWCLGTAFVGLAAQEHPAEPHRHPEGQALDNPIEATPDSRRIGRQRYVFMCRECHGNFGRGDGDMSHAGGVPADFTDDVWQHGESDGEIFTVIKEGVTADMQAYAYRLSDDDIWHLINYLRSLAE